MSSRAARDNAQWKDITRDEARAIALGMAVRWAIDVSAQSHADRAGHRLQGWMVSSMPRGTTAIRFSAPDQDSVATRRMAVNEQHALAAAVGAKKGDAPTAAKARRL